MLPALIDEELDEQARLRAHRDAVFGIEQELRKHEPLHIEPRHYFAHGVYAREITMPAGTKATGRVHKHSQVNIISKGAIRVSTPDGVLEMQAPATFVSPPGTKRAVFALEETVWTTIIGTHETNLDTIVEELTVSTEEEYERHLALAQGKPREIA